MTQKHQWHPYLKGQPPPPPLLAVGFLKHFGWHFVICFLFFMLRVEATSLQFTSSLYNASVPENALGNTAIISDEKMGIFVGKDVLNVKYRITAGDPENFFKTSSRTVGDFCFLELRVKTGNRKVLNRESKSSYLIQIKAQHRRHDKSKEDIPGAVTQVYIKITDLNDISPIFLDAKYQVRISEDTPLYSSVAKVKAEDPDEGLNGQVYYSFQNPTPEFAIHPTSGVISLTRPLSQPEQPRFDLKVVARDRGLQLPGFYPSTASLVINITVVNVFEPVIGVTKLSEPFNNGHLLVMAIVNVRDNDRGPSGEVKSVKIIEGDPDRVFRIIPGSSTNEFNLAALNTLKWDEFPSGFNLSLKVTDNGARPRFSYHPIRINPPPMPSLDPIFTHEEYEVTISESAPPGSRVVGVSTFLPGTRNEITFSIVAGNEGDHFYLDRRSGVLLTARSLDADIKYMYVLTIAASSSGLYKAKQQNSAKVIVRVLDANDHTPIIVAPQGTVTVEEHQNQGSWVTQVRAQDDDSGENNHVSYSLANANEVPFIIDHFTGEIRTSRSLDFETERRMWKLRVRASDWGVPFQRQSEKTIIVRVLDVNDNRPQFEQINCSGYVDRAAPLGTEIFTLSALDFDEGNIISYRILSGNDDRCFSLDSTSGVLTLTCDLQDLISSERFVNVTATDGQHFADTMTLRLQLVHQRISSGPWADLECHGMGIAKKLEEQISLARGNNPKDEEINFRLMTPPPPPNEHAPKVYVARVDVRVRENSDPGYLVHTVEAHDIDEGYDGYLIYAISSGNQDSVFDIGMNTGDIFVVGLLDRERHSRYSLNVTIYDLGQPQKSTSQLIVIHLVDENDNAPKFDKATYSFFLPENVANGTSVYQLLAQDPDEGSNGVISYRLETDTKDFHLDPVFGRLSVARPLDYEKIEVYELRVVATDGGGRSSYAYMTVELVDINDCHPVFPESSSSAIRVPEDLPTGALVTLVTAQDPDSPNLRYILEDSHDGVFELDGNTAALRLAKPLNFETKSVYNLSVRATDDGNPPLSSQTFVIIQVVDVNENVHAPVFGHDVLEAKISEGVPPHSLVVSAPAIDGDLQSNPSDASISYSIVGGEGLGIFYIDQKGDLYTSAWLDRETKPIYWLTIRATDSGTVPRHATLHIYVEVTDVNDNRPLSAWPVYWPAVPENSLPNTLVCTVLASDLDVGPSQVGNITYSISAGNPQSFFRIDKSSGEIRTTERRLDREHSSEHFLHVLISDGDNAATSLSSTAYIIVSVSDENDHAPEFLERIQKISVPLYGSSLRNLFTQKENQAEEEIDSVPIGQIMRSEDLMLVDSIRSHHSMEEGSGLEEIENVAPVEAPRHKGSKHGINHPNHLFVKREIDSHFDVSLYDEEIDFFMEPIMRVIAKDLDEGENAEVSYTMETNEWPDTFKIHPKAGIIYATPNLDPKEDYKLTVIAYDNGRPKKNSTCLLVINPVKVRLSSPNSPRLLGGSHIHTSVLEDDPVGHLVQFINADDEDGDTLWFDITHGNENNVFSIGRENGNIIVARPLDAEKRTNYNLTVAVTDGVNVVKSQVSVSVIDVNDNRPSFSHPTYQLEVSENISPGSTIFTLSASDKDSDKILTYSLVNTGHISSESKFKISPFNGDVVLHEPLDREVQDTHVLTVGVKDRITPNKSNFASVFITVKDYNDHSPHFLESSYSGVITETSGIGTSILQCVAVDKDKGANGHVTYSILSGNIGGVFSLDPELGIISLARSVDMQEMPEYWMSVKASDDGSPPKYTHVNIKIVVKMGSDASPRFNKEEYLFEISEGAKIGTYLGSLTTESHLGVVFSLTQTDSVMPFVINPASGVLSLDKQLDYENIQSYNFSVVASSMNGQESIASVVVSVKDENDNAPEFLLTFYEGHISESAPINSVVLMKNSQPLVVFANDDDSEQNANLVYTILDDEARQYFAIDSSTGAIRTIAPLDHEVLACSNFSVRVHDSGRPQLSSSSAASVSITITDINDVAPRFLQREYNATVLLPTHQGVSVCSLNATDLDFDGKANLVYAIADGNEDGKFRINFKTGLISMNDSTGLKDVYKLKGTISDGQFASSTTINIYLKSLPKTGLRFAREKYFASVQENSTAFENIVMVHVLGSDVNEHINFRILNPTLGYEILETSGVIQTTGIPFDREERDNNILIIEASSSRKTQQQRVAHATVHVVIVDKNDNPPIFVNTPYYGVVPVDSKKSSVVFKVQATDFDAGENSKVRYELQRGNGELFSVGKTTGEITLKQSLEKVAADHELIITAYDGGKPPLSSQVAVRLKVVDRSQPIFDKQFFTAIVVENAQVRTPIITMNARSLLNRKLIYTLADENEHQKFAMEYEEGTITVDDELDFESQSSYQVNVKALDTVTGKSAEVTVSIQLIDTNDNPPKFAQSFYNVSVSEAAAVASPILQVRTSDADSGSNAGVSYQLEGLNGTLPENFYMESTSGMLILKKALDKETASFHHFAVVATDMGTPPLSSTAQIYITVVDMNDNAPTFNQPSFRCSVSEGALRAQFVSLVAASDDDVSDENKLIYSIVSGNDLQAFAINDNTGIVTVWNHQRLKERAEHLLNISVTDGVFTAYTRLAITTTRINAHSPIFQSASYETHIKENSPPETYLTTIVAADEDLGTYGDVTYHFVGEEAQTYFRISENTGEVWAIKSFDRERRSEYSYTVLAVDIGGRTAFAKLTVFIDDENDNRPIFSQLNYKALLQKNSSSGTLVMKVMAEDLDEEVNGEVRYRFHDSTLQNMQSLFNIEKYTGEITLKTEIESRDTSAYEFLVDAVDEGVNSLHSNVAVLIRVINPDVEIPRFSSKVYTFTIDENSEPGSIIESVPARYDGQLEYTIQWSNESPPPLAINSEGTLSIRTLIDYEEKVKFSVVVSAFPKDTPELIASAVVVIEVQDVNDEIPIFESEKYYISAAENMPIGSNILKVSAFDRDSGRNSKVRFLLEEILPLEEEPLFTLDPYSGWLSLNKKLDAEIKSKYDLTVIASDNGLPKQSSKASIIIQVIDYNDNAPEFSREKYEASVRENAIPGTVVLKLHVDDLDVRKDVVDPAMENELEFYITKGNEKQKFHMRRSGQIYVAKELDREDISEYFLTVTVTDGVFVSETQVYLEILDANDNAPLCTHPNYHHLISEDSSAGTLILRVSALDPDIVAPPQYFLAGEGAEKFSMDQSSGQLTILHPLDRESQSKYLLKATIRDGANPKWQCVCTINIVVTDANDNPPIFSQESYSINVPENSPKNLLLKKIYASDPDMGMNRKVSYALEGSSKFIIDRHSGILSVTESLDREKQAMYNLTVTAHDYGSVRLTSSANILVLVSDMNDNPPEFASHTYYTTIMESTNIGSDIVRVLATSRDSGKNAEISYSIIGGNEHRKFGIHQKTGVVSVIDHLDFERGSNYLLTIQAKDGGEPALTNHATVNVTVTDINDNAPIFIQNSYSAVVNEAALTNERLLQVVATDQDSGENGKLTYAISGGDPHMQFRIGEYDGWLSVARPLDRETIPSYTVEVIALDRGIPQRSGSVTIYIEVMDANDNRPVFVAENNTAYVQEDKPIDYLIYIFEVTDNDSDKDRNGAPFTFDIVSGNSDAAFKITPDGELRTATHFSHKAMDLFKLQIRVFDNGRPPLFSDTWINIKIIEESQFSPSMFPLHVMAFVQSDTYFGGTLGKIQASDEDPYDTLKFSIAASHRSSDRKYFALDEKSGVLSSKSSLDGGSYLLNVSVSDDKFTVFGDVSIELVEIDDEMLDGATIVQLRGASPEEFLLSYRRSFHRGIKNIFKVKSNSVIILSIQDPKIRQKREKSSPLYPSYKEGLLDILFVVKKSNDEYLPRSVVRRKLINERKSLETTLGLTIDDIPDDPCKSFGCTNGQCRESITLEEVQVKVSTESVSFVSPFHKHEASCICPPGYSGKLCETVVNQCAYRPCPTYQHCVPQQSEIGYMCVCPSGLVGATCSKNKSDCIGSENTPQCYSPVSPLSLKGKSYIEYLLEHTIERHFSFSVWLRTFHPSGNLLFTSGRLDYSNLEIHEGHIQFRWDLGSGEGLVTVSSLRVDDGFWHHVALERIGSAVFLQVDGKWRAEGSSPGSSEILNLESYRLYLGAEVRPWAGPGKDPRHGFVGCIDDPRIENVRLPLTQSPSSGAASLIRLSNVTPHCYGKLQAPGLCGTHPCLNGGTCEERDSSYLCECASRFRGSQCEIDSNPCASSPCLNNGHCVNESNNYRCECPAQVSGPRCQSMYCNPNPCLNKGSCEEGTSGPICKCKGFTGAYCNVDMNECEKNPCETGGTCINTYGGFKCMCPANLTGIYCDIPAAVTAFPIGVEEIIYIVIGITSVIIFALLIVLIIHCRDKSGSRRQRRMEQNHMILNCKPNDNHHNLYKRTSKMSNIEASQSCTNRPDPLPHNPNEPIYMPLNNFDTIRSYGSAGDELENLPQSLNNFVHNITKSNVHYNQNRNPSSLCNSSLGMSHSGSGMMMPHHSSYIPSDTDLVHRTWKDALALNLKEAYYETDKIQNDVKFNQSDCMNLKKLCGGNELQLHHPRDDSSVRSGASMEDMQEYHWDCSDWARPSQNPLPNILEVPGGEVRDSSSYHSNESNESIIMKTASKRNDIPPVQEPVDPARDMETLATDELTSECETEFELDSRPDLDASSQLLDLGAESDTSLFMPQPKRYETHPNEYLPRYHCNSETETDDERGKLINVAQSPYRKRSNFLPPSGAHPVFQGPYLGVRSVDVCKPLSSPISPSSYSPPVCLRLRNNSNRRQSATMKRASDICPGSMSSAPDDDDAEGISLFGAASNTSDTDNVCDFEDSEVNSEFENDK